MNKLSCPTCGSDQLHFVKALHPQKRTKIILTILLLLSSAVNIFLLFGLISGFDFLGDTTDEESQNLLYGIIIIGIIFLLSIIITVICIGFISNPYYNITESTDYICSCCGKEGHLNDIVSKEIAKSNRDFEGVSDDY